MKKVCFIFLMLCAVVSVSAGDGGKRGAKPVYMLGVSSSFCSHDIFMTQVQKVDGARFVDKSLLDGWSDYSQQLKSFLEGKNLTGRICFVYYNKSKAKLVSLKSKLGKMYRKGNKKVEIVDIPTSDFRFVVPEVI